MSRFWSNSDPEQTYPDASHDVLPHAKLRTGRELREDVISS